jgi:hypothetical protein
MSSGSNAESSAIPSRATSSLQRRVLLGAGLGGAALILALAWAGDVALDRFARRESDTTLSDAAQRGQLLVDQLLADRERQAGVLALTPAVVEAAREGGARAAGLNIAATPAADLEQRFSLERSLQASPATRTFLVGVLPRLDAAEITLTEAHGFNAVTTRRVGDFVQSDEGWWQAAWQDGFSSAGAVYDSTLRRSFVSVAAVVKDGGTRLGVLALSFNAAPLVDALDRAGGGVRIDVVDSTNRIVLSSDSLMLGHFVPALATSRSPTEGVSAVFEAGSERAVASRVNGGRWRLLAHQSSGALAAPYRAARVSLVGAVAILLAVLLGLLVVVHRYLARRISGPATELAIAA